MKNKRFPLNITTPAVMPVLAFTIPFLVMFFLLKDMGFYPFGAKSLVVGDMDQSYIQYYEYFKTFFSGNGNIFFSWSKSMGSAFIGLFAYHLASPFNFIFLFIYPNDVQASLFYMLLIKTAACGLTSYLFFRFTFRSQNTSLLIFSTSYALISYNIMYLQNPMWLDGVVFLPLILLGAEKILRRKTPWLFIISLSVMVISNYYIAYMVIIFSILFILYRYFTEYSQKSETGLLRTAGKFAVYYALSAGLTLWMTLPVLLDLTSGKLDDFLTYIPNHLNNFKFADYLQSFLPGNYTSSDNKGLPALYCGLIIGVFCLAFFMARRISLKKKLFTLVFFIFLFASFYFTVLDTAWHIFRIPNYFPYRYSFVFGFFACFVACDFLISYRKKLKFKTMKIFKMKKVASALFITMIPVIILLPVCIDLSNNAEGLLSGLDNQFHFIKADSYTNFRNENLPLIENIQNTDTSFYRIEKTYQRSFNDSLGMNYKGVTHYSSIYNRNFLDFTREIGLSQSWYWNSYFGSTPVTDSLFSIKYILSKTSMPDSYSSFGGSGNIAVYENPYVLPIGFMSDIEPGKILYSDNYFEVQNSLLNNLAKTDKQYFIRQSDLNCDFDRLEYTFTANYNFPVYIYFPETNNPGGALYVNGKYVREFLRKDDNYVTYIGQFAPGTEVTVSFLTAPYSVDFENTYVYYLDTGAFSQTVQALKAGGLYNISYDNGNIKGEVNASKDGVMFTSIPYDKSFSVKIDGRKTDISSIDSAFLIFNVKSGRHTVEINFIPRGLSIGILVSGVCSVILVLYFAYAITLKKRTKKTRF